AFGYSAGAHLAAMLGVTDPSNGLEGEAAADLLDFRHTQSKFGITLADLYETLADPGANRLRTLHEELDEAVLSAYGFGPDADHLSLLLELNASCADREGQELPVTPPGDPGYDAARISQFRITN
ncbi:MAG: hypothetical protein IH943_11050, partial [Acidobacteria bacterium]|nr:hypothetical protein [Acidobacteriota bacterium]